METNKESYGACDVQTWVDTHGIMFKPMATSDELEKRVDFFIERNEKVKKYCITVGCMRRFA